MLLGCLSLQAGESQAYGEVVQEIQALNSTSGNLELSGKQNLKTGCPGKNPGSVHGT